MKFGELLHNLVDITHGSFGDETSTVAHDAVTDLERRLIALEDHVYGVQAADVSRETSERAVFAAPPKTEEGTDDGAQ